MRLMLRLFIVLIFSSQVFAEKLADKSAEKFAEKPAERFSDNSLFNSTAHLQDQRSALFTLSQQKGCVQVVAFVYTHCISVCPIIVADLKRLDKMLPAKVKNKVHFLLVSLDPENDSSASMLHFLKEHRLTSSRWHFVRGSNDDTRELALLFDVRYRQDATEIAHSNMISVLDTQGVLLYQRKGNDALEPVVDAIRQQLTLKKS